MKRRLPPRTRELARIHLLAKQLGLTRDQYEAVLWAQQAGCDSAADLDEHGRRAVIKQLEARLSAGRTVDGTPPRNMERPLLRKIRAQLAESGKPWAYAAGTAKKLCGKSNLDWCRDDELSRVVAALAISAKRRHDRGGDAS